MSLKQKNSRVSVLPLLLFPHLRYMCLPNFDELNKPLMTITNKLAPKAAPQNVWPRLISILFDTEIKYQQTVRLKYRFCENWKTKKT